MSKFRYKIIAVMLAAALVFTGCSSNQENQSSTAYNTNNSASSSTDSSASTSDSSSTSGSTGVAKTGTKVVVDTKFTANDLDVGYEDNTATHITLQDSSTVVSGDGAVYKDGTLTISSKGTYVITGTLSDGQIVVNAGDKDKVQLVLNGVSITSSDMAPIYVKNADKTFITLKDGTQNSLVDGKNYTQIDDKNVDAVIFSTSDLTINGSGALTITGNYKHGIVSKDDLVITGGTFDITTVKNAINSKNCVKIKDGTFNLTTQTGNGIKSKNSDDETKGYVYITGGSITINSGAEGIEGTEINIADGTINVTAADDGLNASSGSSTANNDNFPGGAPDFDKFNPDGNTKNTPSNTDTDATSGATVNTDPAAVTDTTTTNAITVSNTTSSTATASDAADASMDTSLTSANRPARGEFHGKGGFGGGGMENDESCLITISGGTINVNASGDGLDSNGSIKISGGTIYMSGPTENNNGALDYNGTADITGGTIIATGSTGMAQGFSDTSSQYSLLYDLTSASNAGTEVKLTDKDGNALITFQPAKQYQSIVISTPKLTKDATYTLTSGSQTADITLSSVVTSNAPQGGNGFFGR